MTSYVYNSYSGREPGSDEGWSKSTSQHVCRPVIIDAEGRKQPIIRYTAPTPTPHNTSGSYVTKTETFVERVHSPALQQYTGQYVSSPTMLVLPPEDPYEFNKHGQTLHSTVHNRPQKVEEFITKVQTEASNEPIRTIPFGTTTYRRPTGTGYNSPTATGYSNPTGTGYNSPTGTGYNIPTGTGYNDYNTNTGYGGYNDYKNNTDYGDYNDHKKYDDYLGYNNNNNGGHNSYNPRDRNEPNRAGYWSTRPSGQETGLTKPTSDISTAIEYLKEAATTIGKPLLGNNGTTTTTTATATNVTRPRFIIGVPPPKKSDFASTTSTTTSVETITSSEAKKKYGNPSSLPYTTGEKDTYASTIDSREAMRRYNGRSIV